MSEELTFHATSTPRRMGDFECWHLPCDHCGFDPGKTKCNKCWKCGRRVYRDFSDRALKLVPARKLPAVPITH